MAKKKATKLSKAMRAQQLDQRIKSLDTLPQDFAAPHDSLVFRAVRAEATMAPVRNMSLWQGFRVRRVAFIGAAMACSAAAFLSFGLTTHQISDPATLANGGQTQSQTGHGAANSLPNKPTNASTVVISSPSDAKPSKPSKHGKPVIKKNPKLNIVMSDNQSVGSQTSQNGPKAGSSMSSSIMAPGVGADMKIRCMGIYGGWCGSVITKYAPADSLSNKASTGHVYQLVANQNPKELGTAVAGAFGLKDTVHSWVDEYSGQTNYFVGTDPTSQDAWSNNAAGVVIYKGGNSNYWYYYNQAAAVYPDCTPIAAPSDSSVGSDVTIDPNPCQYLPPTSSNAPSQSAAYDFATKVLDSLGYQTVTSLKHAKDNTVLLNYQSDVWGSTVMANLIVEGQPTTISWYIYWNGMSGQVVNMSGTNSIAKDAGLFDTLSPVKAAERVGTWQWSGAFYTNNDFNWGSDRPYPSYPPLCSAVYPTPEPVVVDPAPVESAPADPAPTPTPTDPASAPTDPVVIVDPAPCVDQPTTNLISLNSSQSTLMQVVDGGQNIWLVPGYLYFDDYGYVQSTISLPDGIIKLPENAPIVMY
jgi:hypothetical protein